MSPFLFSFIYINDLEKFLIDKNIFGLQSVTKLIQFELVFFFYFKLCIMIYSDDSVVLAETPDDLQNGLNEFYSYCE